MLELCAGLRRRVIDVPGRTFTRSALTPVWRPRHPRPRLLTSIHPAAPLQLAPAISALPFRLHGPTMHTSSIPTSQPARTHTDPLISVSPAAPMCCAIAAEVEHIIKPSGGVRFSASCLSSTVYSWCTAASRNTPGHALGRRVPRVIPRDARAIGKGISGRATRWDSGVWTLTLSQTW